MQYMDQVAAHEKLYKFVHSDPQVKMLFLEMQRSNEEREARAIRDRSPYMEGVFSGAALICQAILSGRHWVEVTRVN